MKNSYTKVMLYSITHLLVDLACAYLLFSKIFDTKQWLLCVLLYNFCAFALQMPIGLLADRWNRNAVCAAIGCILTAAAYGCWDLPIIAALMAGVGNGMFHVGGGIDVLNLSQKKSGLLGVFVAPGAFGLYIGTIYAKQGVDTAAYIVLALLLMALLTLLLQYAPGRTFRSDNESLSFQTKSLADTAGQNDLRAAAAAGAMACMFLVVCLRSYVGMTLSFPWKGEGSWGLILVCAVVLGKIAGGILADVFGALKTTAASLGLAAILFLFSGYPTSGIAAVFLFNMTMPITLWAVARILPGSKGFTFGLLTFGLFLGFIPVYLGTDPLLSGGGGFAAATVVSLALLCAGLIIARSGWVKSKSAMGDPALENPSIDDKG
ncbi:MAG: MFS transporter [Clostridiaceae bacterium]|nr:MFS transporter [Clostridiaceae bacterium]